MNNFSPFFLNDSIFPLNKKHPFSKHNVSFESKLLQLTKVHKKDAIKFCLNYLIMFFILIVFETYLLPS